MFIRNTDKIGRVHRDGDAVGGLIAKPIGRYTFLA
jgi:hypothetical protein